MFVFYFLFCLDGKFGDADDRSNNNNGRRKRERKRKKNVLEMVKTDEWLSVDEWGSIQQLTILSILKKLLKRVLKS